jgi:hypothetical protein
MPDPEIHYFSREFHRGNEWYLNQFIGTHAGQVNGEKSNSYLDSPHCASLIRKSIPHARLIAQLRNPVERAYSDYCMLYRRAEVTRDIAEYLDPRRASKGRFLQGGLYHDQLMRFYDEFPSKQLAVFLFEDFKMDGKAQLANVKEFIGIAADNLALSGKVKDKTAPMLSPELRRKTKWLRPLVAPFRKTPAFAAARRLLVREVTYAPLSKDLRSRLIDYYASEAEKLGKLLQRDLTEWLQSNSERPQA